MDMKPKINIGEFFLVPMIKDIFVVLEVADNYFICEPNAFSDTSQKDLCFKINFDDIESYEENSIAIREMKLNSVKTLEIQKAILKEEIRFAEKEIEIQTQKLENLKTKLEELEKE